MNRFRSIGRTALFVVLSTTCSSLMVGCGGDTATTTGTVYSSPEEIKEKTKELKNAMQGGAYGSAGKKAAGQVGGK
ncbi:MAG: hypothetical protein P4L85_24480 [Paludisphaera borealis]|uniref:hypothetical protein n=1 Tax=Paludisphaera borealis TaxID=1387353 RepID=UPI00284D0407|nr:hypothetical protein [Paludisphaera borealis]MDR3622531.1 hypothetical protein [Paludisphaera borealis]